MRKPEHWKTVAIILPIAFLFSGCFTQLTFIPEERLPGDRPPPPPPPPVIIIENHYYPLPPAPDPPPPERKRPFDRHEPGDSKGEIDKSGAGRRSEREENIQSGGSENEQSEGRSPRR